MTASTGSDFFNDRHAYSIYINGQMSLLHFTYLFEELFTAILLEKLICLFLDLY